MTTKAKASRFFYTLGRTKISGTATGCFAVITAENKCSLYNAKGEKVVSEINAFDGMLLNDDSYFLLRLPAKDSPRAHSYLLNVPVWSLFDKNGTLLLADQDACKIYPNGWYRVTQNDHHQLYRADHTLVAEGFSQCAVYTNGYALRNNPPYYKYADWRMYTPEGELVYNTRDTISILGNGFPLQRSGGLEETFSLYNIAENEIIAKNIVGFHYYPNDRFILTFEDPKHGKFSQIYTPDGCRFGISTQNAMLLPDGRFVQYHNNRISALYRKNGLIETDDIWTVEVAGNYYLIGFENVETLYNDKSEDLGEGYCLINWLKNFVLLENEQEYRLFNQYGEVMTFPVS